MYPRLDNRPWRVVKSENILRIGPWLSVRQECVELPSGTQIPTWFILEFPDWINVIAITKDGKMVMEDQYRHALGETHYEIVAGVVDPGETPLQAAQRELSEETGYEGGEWQLFMTLSPNPTNHNNRSYTFLADQLPVTNKNTGNAVTSIRKLQKIFMWISWSRNKCWRCYATERSSKPFTPHRSGSISASTDRYTDRIQNTDL